MTSKRIKMSIEMEVTVPQALALQAMFNRWNQLAAMGSSRIVGFYVDGDGNFHPKVKITTDENIPELTPEMVEAAWTSLADLGGFSEGDGVFDFDPIAWKMNNK